MTLSKRKWVLLLVILLIVTALAAGLAGGWQKAASMRSKDYVAVVRIDGEIYGGAPSQDMFNATGSASEDIMAQLEAARKDVHAKAVLLRINSPGGSTGATQEISEELDKIKNSGKPIVVSMGDECASAGYWLASKGDYIFANPATLTGSIGVYMDYTNVEELMDKLGIRNEKIKSGAHKDIMSMYRPMTDEERAMLQAMVNDIYDQFVNTVAEGRHMDKDKVKAIADGRVLTGKQAQALGLVDAMGNYYDALGYAGGLVGMDEDVPTHSYVEGFSIRTLFSAEMENLSQMMGRQMASAFRSALSSEQEPVIK